MLIYLVKHYKAWCKDPRNYPKFHLRFVFSNEIAAKLVYLLRDLQGKTPFQFSKEEKAKLLDPKHIRDELEYTPGVRVMLEDDSSSDDDDFTYQVKSAIAEIVYDPFTWVYRHHTTYPASYAPLGPMGEGQLELGLHQGLITLESVDPLLLPKSLLPVLLVALSPPLNTNPWKMPPATELLKHFPLLKGDTDPYFPILVFLSRMLAVRGQPPTLQVFEDVQLGPGWNYVELLDYFHRREDCRFTFADDPVSPISVLFPWVQQQAKPTDQEKAVEDWIEQHMGRAAG